MPQYWAQSALRRPIIWLLFGITCLVFSGLMLGLRMRDEYRETETQLSAQIAKTRKDILDAQAKAKVAETKATAADTKVEKIDVQAKHNSRAIANVERHVKAVERKTK